VNNLDATVVALVLLEFRLNLGRVAYEKQFPDVGILFERHDGSADDIGRPEIAAHGIQSDFHGSVILRRSEGECKIKNGNGFPRL
jgi:hypothetical protein